MKDRILRFVFDRYMVWRLDQLTAPRHAAILEYRLKLRPRYGYGRPPHQRLHEIIGAGRERYAAQLRRIVALKDDLARIAAESPPGASPKNGQPTFFNSYFSGLDAAALYALLVELNPSRYFEVGSGNSTKFARRAIADHKLRTAISSFDPAPRAEIDAICDTVIRQGLEDVDPARFDELEAGDILFVDNSHYAFMNSDVTTMFMDVLPRLKPGVVVHLHDILLPYDYPPHWRDRHYNEQYLLACCLLSAPDRYEVILPNAFVSADADLSSVLEALWQDPRLTPALKHMTALIENCLGASFWLRT